MKKAGFLTLILLGITLFACQESGQEVVDVNDSIEPQNTFQPDQRAVEIDQYIEKVDNNFDLSIYSSLEYTKGDGDTYEEYVVHAYQDGEDTNYVKLVEYSSDKTCSFYYKNGKKIASREVAEEGTDADLHFVERVTYYGDDESPLVTKERVAVFEEQLAGVAFTAAKATALSEDKAFRALDQSGEFTPLFETFLEGEELFMIVGENKPDGYISALLVQSLNGVVGRIYKDPKAYVGKQLSVAFSNEKSSDGDYQLLHGASLVE